MSGIWSEREKHLILCSIKLEASLRMKQIRSFTEYLCAPRTFPEVGHRVKEGGLSLHSASHVAGELGSSGQ